MIKKNLIPGLPGDFEGNIHLIRVDRYLSGHQRNFIETVGYAGLSISADEHRHLIKVLQSFFSHSNCRIVGNEVAARWSYLRK